MSEETKAKANPTIEAIQRLEKLYSLNRTTVAGGGIAVWRPGQPHPKTKRATFEEIGGAYKTNAEVLAFLEGYGARAGEQVQ